MTDGDDLIRGFAAQLRDTDPASPAWSYWPPHTAAFWMRRAAMEEVVHRWDAEGIAGDPTPIDAAIASDGIDEVVEALIPFWLSSGQVRPPRSLEISATDLPRTWTIQGSDPAAPSARVSGLAGDMFLALWSREHDELNGDVVALGSWAALGAIF